MKIPHGIQHPWRSAGFQPAVSPTSSRQGVRSEPAFSGLETSDTAGCKSAPRCLTPPMCEISGLGNGRRVRRLATCDTADWKSALRLRPHRKRETSRLESFGLRIMAGAQLVFVYQPLLKRCMSNLNTSWRQANAGLSQWRGLQARQRVIKGLTEGLIK